MASQLILNGIMAGSIYALISIGFTVIYRTVRFFHLAKARVFTSGAIFLPFPYSMYSPGFWGAE